MKLPVINRSSRALPPPFKAVRWIAALALVAGISGACEVHDPVGPSEIATITVSPNPTLTILGTQQFEAIAQDAQGREVAFSPVWSVEDGGGTINSTSGMFTAGTTLGVFTATIRATDNGRYGSATVTVIAGAAVSLTVTPNPHALPISGTQQFTATAVDAGGNPVPVTPTWSVVNGGGAINPTSGMFTAGTTAGPFNNTVRATSGTLSGTATVTVTPGPAVAITVLPNPRSLAIGAVQQFTATAVDAGGNAIPITPTWSVVAGGGTIVPSTGVFTAGATPGIFTNTVRATSGALFGSATVTVLSSAPAAIITVLPNPATMPVNGTQQFTATAVDGGGNPVAFTPVWSVVAGGGTIHPVTGLFTAGTTAGTFTSTVRATSGAVFGSATVTVTAGSLATIQVLPHPATMGVNETQPFTASGRDAHNNPIVLAAPVWSVVAGGGTIDALTGAFTAGSATGTFNNTVRASSGGIDGFATVVVTAVPPPPAPSPLGSAENFGILAGAGINCAISGSVTGGAITPSDIGTSPTLTITGFPPCTFAGSIPAPGVVATAKADLTAAYLAAQGQVCDLDLSGVDLGFYGPGNPLPPGTYCFSSSAAITGTLQLTGSAAATWTFQIGTTLTTAVGSQVLLAGGAIPDNVYWAVGSSATLGTNSAFQGTIMALASITLNGNATLLGRALAQTGAVDMIVGGASIVKP